MQFVYVDDEQQLAYSPTRGAIGEWVRSRRHGRDKWVFLGWLHDGHVHDIDQARELIKPWLALRGEA
jgi:hypothetical protein